MAAAFHVFEDNENQIPKKHCDEIPFNNNTKLCNKLQQNRRAPLVSLYNKAKKPKVTFKVKQEEEEVVSHKIENFVLFSEGNDVNLKTETTKENEEVEYAFEDTLCVKEYALNIWDYMNELEWKFSWPKENYMSKQTHLNQKMRAILIDWLATITYEYNLNEQTLHLCTNYIDRFLSYMSVVQEKFQLLGVTAMMLAVKVEEVEIINTQEWAYLTGSTYTEKQIVRMEQLLLKVLQFDVNPPTVVSFIKQLCVVNHLDKRTLHMAMYLSELILLEGGYYLKFLPSRLAVAAVVLSRFILGKSNPWFEALENLTGYSFQQLKPVIMRQYKTFQDSPTKQQQAIQNKYKTEKYHRVATVTPRILELEDCEDEIEF